MARQPAKAAKRLLPTHPFEKTPSAGCCSGTLFCSCFVVDENRRTSSSCELGDAFQGMVAAPVEDMIGRLEHPLFFLCTLKADCFSVWMFFSSCL